MFSFSQTLKIIETSLLNVLITNYILFSSAEISKAWDFYGLLMLLFVDLVIMVSTYYQLRVMNSQETKSNLRNAQRFFGRLIQDQKYEEIVQSRSRYRSAYRFLMLNYHFLGLIKKLLLFLVLVAVKERFLIQIYLVYGILGA